MNNLSNSQSTETTPGIPIPLTLCTFEGLEFVFQSSKQRPYGILQDDKINPLVSWRQLVGICVELMRTDEGDIITDMRELLPPEFPVSKAYLLPIKGRANTQVRKLHSALIEESGAHGSSQLESGEVSILPLGENTFSAPAELSIRESATLIALVLGNTRTEKYFPDQFCPFLRKYILPLQGSEQVTTMAQNVPSQPTAVAHQSRLMGAYEDLCTPPRPMGMQGSELRDILLEAVGPELRRKFSL
jgi:hypothetical protein